MKPRASCPVNRHRVSCSRFVKGALNEGHILKTSIKNFPISLATTTPNLCYQRYEKDRGILTVLFPDSARTPVGLHKMNLICSPLCSACGVTGGVGDFFIDCREHATERSALLNKLLRRAAPHGSLGDVTFPKGHWITKRDTFALALRFLKDTSFSDPW